MFTIAGLLGWWYARHRFISTVWISASTNEPVRLRMVDDLLRRYKLIGMSREQIDNLLGVPPQTEYFAEYDYIYWLGPERSFISIDSEWLCIKFQNDSVIAARLMRD